MKTQDNSMNPTAIGIDRGLVSQPVEPKTRTLRALEPHKMTLDQFRERFFPELVRQNQSQAAVVRDAA